MKYMIIENDLELIKKYNKLKIDRIFLDLEILGKEQRQGHLNTVISSHHKIEDVKKISKILSNSSLLVRVNPINEQSFFEINKCIKDGADILMLPMFKTVKEVSEFIEIVDGRVKTCLLLETAEALCRVDDIIEIEGIDEIHIGLNDLHLSMNLKFMFELLSGGIVEYILNKLKEKNIPYGFGGIAALDDGIISGNMILKEHVRLNSSMVILSRTFKEMVTKDFELFENEFLKMKNTHRDLCVNFNQILLDNNRIKLKKIIKSFVNE